MVTRAGACRYLAITGPLYANSTSAHGRSLLFKVTSIPTHAQEGVAEIGLFQIRPAGIMYYI